MKLANWALGFVCCAALLTQACFARGTRPENMRPTTPLLVAKRHSGAVRVSVLGGKETNPLWKSEISSESFAEALKQAISSSGLFAAVRTDSGTDYLLEVVFTDVDEPLLGGFNMTVTLTARWSLVASKTNQTVWRKDIVTPFTAGVGDAFSGVERLRVANEGAARENIKVGLEELSKVTL